MKGVPIRLALGLRDLAQGKIELARRDEGTKELFAIDEVINRIPNLLEEIQDNMFSKAKAFRDNHITKADTMEEMVKILDEKTGFVSAHWDGSAETEEEIQKQTKATIRCIPLNNIEEEGKCILTGKPSKQRVLFARAY